MIQETAEGTAMADENAELRAEVARLTAENERLKKQLVETRAQRAEAVDALCRLMPPVELPTEEEMIEQMKHMIPADRVLREIRERKRNGIVVLQQVGFIHRLPPLDRAHVLGFFAQPTAVADEAAILRYLESGQLYATVPGVEDDPLLDGRPLIGPMHICTDGVFAWPQTLAYWVKTHHVRLPAEFVQHMKVTGWVIPQDLDCTRMTLD